MLFRDREPLFNLQEDKELVMNRTEDAKGSDPVHLGT